MGLGVGEIRDRAERLKREVARERYEVNAGLRPDSRFSDVYRAHALLTGEEALPAIQRELAEAAGEERRRLRYLLAWVAEQRIEAALSPLEDELRTWEAGATVTVGEATLPLRGVARAVAEEPDRSRRLALERGRDARVEEGLPLRLEMIEREREAIAELGFGDFLETRERLSGVNIRALEREAVRVLEGTEAAYRELLEERARGRLRVAPDAVDRADVRWLARATWLDGAFRVPAVLEAVREDLRALGLPLETNGRVRLDTDERALRMRSAFCVPLGVPEEIVLVVGRSGGRRTCERLLHEVGHCLHVANTDRALPFEYRALGDTAVTETYALLFQLLLLEPAWVRRATGMDREEVEEHRALSSFLALYLLRRQAAEVLYQVELYGAESPAAMAPRYAELLGGATGVRFDPRTFLEDVDRGFWVTRQLRAWMLVPILIEQLRERYDEDWYRNPAAGPFLGELFSAGQRDDASELAVQLGAECLGAGRLLASVERWVG